MAAAIDGDVRKRVGMSRAAVCLQTVMEESVGGGVVMVAGEDVYRTEVSDVEMSDGEER